MNRAKNFIALLLLAMPMLSNAQGNSCTMAHTLTVDGVYRNYAVLLTTGSCVICSMSGYSGENGFADNLTTSENYYTPPNDNCLGATYLRATAVQDNNSCHTTGRGVLPAQLCPTTLQNTAWYTYYTLNAGSPTITIDNIN